MVAMVELATHLPFDYYRVQESGNSNDIGTFSFLETCKDHGKQYVMDKIFELEADVSRANFE